ncbi:MAG: hypothetical protein ACTHQM_21475 [Thermoanaerobaculia bacterium]
MLPHAFRSHDSVLKKQAMGRERELGRQNREQIVERQLAMLACNEARDLGPRTRRSRETPLT